MDKLKNILLYFIFTFSVIFLIINFHFILPWESDFFSTSRHGLTYALFIFLTILSWKNIYKDIFNKRKFKFLPWLISICLIIIYILPIWNIKFWNTWTNLEPCNYNENIEASSYIFNNDFKENWFDKQKFAQSALQIRCAQYKYIFKIPFILDLSVAEDYYLYIINKDILNNNDSNIEKPIVNKFLLNNYFLDYHIEKSRNLFKIIKDKMKEAL